MTKQLQLILIVILGLVSLPSCGTQQVQGDRAAQVRNFVAVIEPSIRPSAKVACSLYLSYAVNEKDRADLKANIFTVSSIISAATGDVSPSDLSKQIQGQLDSSPESKSLADGIAGAWAIALPFVRGDPALLIKVTSDLAAGCTDATK